MLVKIRKNLLKSYINKNQFFILRICEIVYFVLLFLLRNIQKSKDYSISIGSSITSTSLLSSVKNLFNSDEFLVS